MAECFNNLGYIWTFVLCILSYQFGKTHCQNIGNFIVGVGIGDVTGPVGIGMMGYAAPDQIASGIHTRLFSRAFYFESNGISVTYVSVDIGMIDQAIKTRVVELLEAKYIGFTFNHDNVLLSGTHTHSGPGGYMQYLLYGLTTLGFSRTNFDTIVAGIVDSISKAYESRERGNLFISSGRLDGANRNRSPTSYLENPADERARYGNDDVDKEMVVLRVESANGTARGLISWFAVHGTSMNKTNQLISGDNKGYASMLYEYKMNPNSRPGEGAFVAAFGSTNLGDVSPNIQGAKCIKEPGMPECNADSTCGPLHSSQFCIAFGPGLNGDMQQSTEIIGRLQFEKAKELFEDAGSLHPIDGPVHVVHQFVRMSEYQVNITDKSTGAVTRKQLCKGALGEGFAAGTTDGPGVFLFKQGEVSGNKFWDAIRNNTVDLTPEYIACHEPKPILLPVGELHVPYDWSADIVETQILMIGNLFIAAVPGEMTTMAGRRFREALTAKVKDALSEAGFPEPTVVIAGLSNVYTHYITTFEEYQKQRYEGASTLFGPHTLDAYLYHYSTTLADAIFNNNGNDEPGPTPPNLLSQQFSVAPSVLPDVKPLLRNFGDVERQPLSVARGGRVSARFVAGNPGNDPLRGKTFLAIERLEGGAWKTVRTDADWDTKCQWFETKLPSVLNHVEITWDIPVDMATGTYRIKHFGVFRNLLLALVPYEGTSRRFQVL